MEIKEILKRSQGLDDDLTKLGSVLCDKWLPKMRELENAAQTPEDIELVSKYLNRIEAGMDELKNKKEIVTAYGELLSMYITSLSRSATVNRQHPLIRMILKNVVRRKAPELSKQFIFRAFARLRRTITVAIIAKRYGVYVLAVQGLSVLFRSEIDFRTHGVSPPAD